MIRKLWQRFKAWRNRGSSDYNEITIKIPSNASNVHIEIYGAGGGGGGKE